MTADMSCSGKDYPQASHARALRLAENGAGPRSKNGMTVTRKAWIAVSALMGAAAMAGLLPEGVVAMEDKAVVGWVEQVRISPGGIVLKAKVDTGADNSSIHVNGFTLFDRSGEQWVRFELADRDGKTVTMERPVVRMVKIKRHNGASLRRPVVMLEICLGTHRRSAQVNLVDRSRFSFPMLIGRSFLRPTFLVDPDKRFTAPPACAEDSK